MFFVHEAFVLYIVNRLQYTVNILSYALGKKMLDSLLLSSVQFIRSVVSDSLWPHGLQHARPPCPSPTPRACSDSCPSSWWCHPTISSSVVPSPPAFNLFQHQGLFQWVSSSHQVAKVLEFQLQHQSFQWIFRTGFLGWTHWISLQSKKLSIVFSNTTVQKHQFLGTQFFFIVQLSHPYMTTGKTIALTRWTKDGSAFRIGRYLLR